MREGSNQQNNQDPNRMTHNAAWPSYRPSFYQDQNQNPNANNNYCPNQSWAQSPNSNYAGFPRESHTPLRAMNANAIHLNTSPRADSISRFYESPPSASLRRAVLFAAVYFGLVAVASFTSTHYPFFTFLSDVIGFGHQDKVIGALCTVVAIFYGHAAFVPDAIYAAATSLLWLSLMMGAVNLSHDLAMVKTPLQSNLVNWLHAFGFFGYSLFLLVLNRKSKLR
jgi:hypothetical protein